MKNKKIISGLLFAFSVLSFNSCGKDDGKKTSSLEDVVGDDLSEYGQASCKYKYEEGNLATALNSADVETTFFNKRLDFSLLNPVLPASGAETVRFAESNNVRFYKTSFRDKKNCEFVKVLPQAPKDLAQEFSKNDEDNNLLGLYLEAGTPNLPSVAKQGAILLRRDGNKWVLVHEYMHHLYRIQKVADFGVPSEDIKTRVMRLTEEFDKQNNELDMASLLKENYPEKLKKTSAKMIEAQAGLLELIIEYSLEEMTIESVLAQKLEHNELKYVVDQRVNGAAYTISSASFAQTTFILPMWEEINEFLSKYKNDMTPESQDAFSELKVKIVKTNNEIIELNDKAQKFLASVGYEYKNLRMVPTNAIGQSKEPQIGCSHQNDMNEVTTFFNERRKQKH